VSEGKKEVKLTPAQALAKALTIVKPEEKT